MTASSDRNPRTLPAQAPSRSASRTPGGRTNRALGFAAALLLAGAAAGQECSGGPAGGTDATGNQCNAPTTLVASPAPAAASPAAESRPATPAPNLAPAATAPEGAMTPAAHRKKLFDERRARFEGSSQERLASAGANRAGSTGAAR